MSRYTKKYYPDGATATFIDGELVEGTPPTSEVSSGPYVMPDLSSAYKEGGFQSTIDQTWITSRSQLAEHNKRHNVIHAGDMTMKQRMERTKKAMRFDPSLRGKVNWVDPKLN